MLLDRRINHFSVPEANGKTLNFLEYKENLSVPPMDSADENHHHRAKMIRRLRKFFVFISILFLAGLTLGCSTLSEPLASDALLANEDEKILWRKSREEQRLLDSSGLIYQDPELESYLNQVAAILQPQPAPADLPIRVKVIKNAYLNAFAYPNGVIYIHSGLLARMDNEAQLSAVLAHEMTHFTQRHALRAFRRVRDRASFLSAIQQKLMATKGLQELARNLGFTGSLAAVRGYTRELEAEADRVGIDLMLKAGYDPKEALFLFDHLASEIEQEGFKEPFFFGSHPKVQQRVDNLQKLPDGLYAPKRPAIKDSEVFLAILGKLIFDTARLDLRLGRFRAARRGIEKYLRTQPHDTRAYFILGEIFRQRGQADDTRTAIKYYNQAILLDPTYADPHKAIGLIHYKEGHRALAKKFFESCLQLSPDSPDKFYIQGYLKKFTQDGEG